MIDLLIMDKIHRQSLKKFMQIGDFIKNDHYSLSYNECEKNNHPCISVTIKRDWFIIEADFNTCDYYVIESVREDIDKDIDNALGFILGYKTATGSRKSKIPRHSTEFGGGYRFIDLPPIHKKYYKKIIKKILDYCFLPQYRTKNSE